MKVVLGEKYGPNLLPKYIPPEEFTAIYVTAKQHRRMEINEINDKIAKVEKASSDREQRRQQLAPENSDLERDDHLLIGRLEDELNIEARTTSSKARTHAEMLKREQQVMKSLKEIRESLPSPELLQQWYKLDENLNPPVYRLQNIRYSIEVLKY